MVEVKKDNVTKKIPKELAKQYVAAGWKLVEEKKEDKKFELNNKND